ncbi:hypothetical protein JCM33374_g6640 [Metschnikowia sp. JCM 33374]|nr:hypothetical protein JCM33374_g6640 [Metschnikowia sp. JCM 33374]
MHWKRIETQIGIFIYAKSPVMWRSKITIATSTLMAELAALFEAREAIWIKKLFKELDIKTKDDVTPTLV